MDYRHDWFPKYLDEDLKESLYILMIIHNYCYVNIVYGPDPRDDIRNLFKKLGLEDKLGEILQ